MNVEKNRMNGWLYSFWAKTLVILLALCMAGMACCGGYLIARNLEALTVEEAWNGVDYGNSRNAYNRMLIPALNVIENKVYQSSYLKDGVFDGEDTVDILNPEAHSDQKKNEVTTYKLKDLLTLYESQNLERITDCVSTAEDYDECYDNDRVTNLEDSYGIENFFRDKKNNLYGVTGGIRGVNNTRDVVRYELGDWEEELVESEMAQFQGSSEYLYVINPDGSARAFVFGVDKDVELTYTSRAEVMARLMDTSELGEKEDISQFYGVYGESFCYLYNNCRVLESVKPLSGRSIAVYALLHPYDFSILDTYKALIDVTGQVYTAYIGAEKVVNCENLDRSLAKANEELPETIKKQETMYYYHDLSSDKVFTNVADWESLQAVDVYKIVKGYEEDYSAFPYIYYRVEDSNSAGTLNAPVGISQEAENEVYLWLASYLQGKDNYAMIILHNPEFQLHAETDLFPERVEMQGAAYATEFRNGVIFCGAGCALFLLLLLIAMIQVANPGGQMQYTEDGKRNRQATAFTKNIPICLLLILMLMAWGLWGGAMGFVIDFCHDLRGMQPHFMTILLSFGISGAAVLLWTILTLLAKIKTRTFFKNSLIGWCFGTIRRGIKTVYHNRKATGRMLLVYGVITLVAFLGFLFVVSEGEIAIGTMILFVDWLGLGYYLFKKSIQRQALKESIEEIAGGNLEHQIQLDKLSGDEKEMADNLNNLKGGMQNAINEQMKSERMKTDLITNVSHDIKTPLTSIINYVDLLKREDIQDEKIAGYIEILDNKSARLKQLTEDLVEASKISSGNIVLECVNLDLGQLIQQVNGEFLEKFEKRNLELVCDLPEEPMIVYADGRRISRVFENLYNNVAKYAMPGTRVYVTGKTGRDEVILSIKNISEQPLNVSAEELMERFVRGDVSRSTEGSGLGLEIARNLTLMQNGQFDLFVDGDLFRVTTSWKRSE